MRKLVRKSRLSGFWRSVWRRYGRVVLDEAQIEWILKAKGRGMKNGHIAMWPAKRENYSDPTLNAIARVKTPPAEGPYKQDDDCFLTVFSRDSGMMPGAHHNFLSGPECKP